MHPHVEGTTKSVEGAAKRVKYKGAIGGEGTANRGGCSGGKLRNTTPVNVCGVVITRTVGGILQEIIEQ